MPPIHSDATILSMLRRRGDEEKGFRLLTAKYGQSLYWHIRRTVIGHDDAEDVLQETVIRYMQKAPAFNSPEHEKACSFSIYSLSVYQKCRKCQRENTLWHKYYPAASGILNDRIAAHG